MTMKLNDNEEENETKWKWNEWRSGCSEWLNEICRPHLTKVLRTWLFFTILMRNRALATVSCTFGRPHLARVLRTCALLRFHLKPSSSDSSYSLVHIVPASSSKVLWDPQFFFCGFYVYDGRFQIHHPQTKWVNWNKEKWDKKNWDYMCPHWKAVLVVVCFQTNPYISATPSPNKPPRQSSPNLLWHRSSTARAALAPKRTNLPKKCPGAFPHRISKCIFHMFAHASSFFTFFQTHFQYAFCEKCKNVIKRKAFWKWIVKQCEKCILKMCLENCETCNLKMWKMYSHNHLFWSSNLCSYIGVAHTATAEKQSALGFLIS